MDMDDRLPWVEALCQVLKCHKIFNKYFNLLELGRKRGREEEWGGGENGCWVLPVYALSWKFSQNCAVCDNRQALKMLYFHFQQQSNFISFRKLYNKVASKMRQRGSCNKNYDDFLIKQRRGSKNSPTTTTTAAMTAITITSFVAKWKAKIVQIRALFIRS